MASLTSEQFVQQVVVASRVGVPIIGVSSADQRATIKKLCDTLIASEQEKEKDKPLAFLTWNCLDGMVSAVKDEAKIEKSVKERAAQTLAALSKPPSDEDNEFETADNDDRVLVGPIEMLQAIRKNLPPRSVVFIQNAHLFLNRDFSAATDFLQGVWNLRKAFKSDRRLLILLAPDFKAPPELKDDIVVYDDPLPTEEEIGHIVRKLEAPLKTELPQQIVERCTDSVLGLSAFAAEQALFLSLKRDKDKIQIDFDQLRHVKRTLIRQTPGLRVSEEGYRFDDIGGVSFIKEFLHGIINGRKPPKLIVFVDEIEKAMGATGDNTGVSQDILGQMLQHMENTRARGSIFVGPPGCTKTMLARAMGNEAGIDTVEFDLGGVKQGEVGASERNIRQALKVIGSCSRGSSYWIATSNNLSVIPAELRRRYTDGIWFFDLPATQEELKAIWDIQIKANKLEKKQYAKIPDDKGWTGAEIRNCCAIAYDRNVSLTEAARFINPVSVSSRDLIQRLRKDAAKKFMSASRPGTYQLVTDTVESDNREVDI